MVKACLCRCTLYSSYGNSDAPELTTKTVEAAELFRSLFMLDGMSWRSRHMGLVIFLFLDPRGWVCQLSCSRSYKYRAYRDYIAPYRMIPHQPQANIKFG